MISYSGVPRLRPWVQILLITSEVEVGVRHFLLLVLVSGIGLGEALKEKPVYSHRTNPERREAADSKQIAPVDIRIFGADVGMSNYRQWETSENYKEEDRKAYFAARRRVSDAIIERPCIKRIWDQVKEFTESQAAFSSLNKVTLPAGRLTRDPIITPIAELKSVELSVDLNGKDCDKASVSFQVETVSTPKLDVQRTAFVKDAAALDDQLERVLSWAVSDAFLNQSRIKSQNLENSKRDQERKALLDELDGKPPKNK